MNEEAYFVSDKDFDWNEYERDGRHLIENESIEGLEPETKVYSHEPYAQKLYNKMTNPKSPKFVRKDLKEGEFVKVTDIPTVRETQITIELETGITVDIDLTKEKKFMNLFGYKDATEFAKSLRSQDQKESFLSNDICALVIEAEPSIRVSLWEGYIKKQKEEFLKEISSPSKAYVAKIVEANKGGYFVEVQGVRAFMPGSLAAPNKISNFESLVGTNVTVMIEDYLRDMDSFIVSHKKYLKHIIPIKIKDLSLDEQYMGYVTGTSKYGIFVEFQDIFTGLLHTSKMKPETFHDFKRRKFSPGDVIYFYINEITKDNRIILTEESLSDRKSRIDTFVEENKDRVLDATIVAKMAFGFIIKIGDISGLIINKDIDDKRAYNNGDVIQVKYKEKNEEKLIFKIVE